MFAERKQFHSQAMAFKKITFDWVSTDSPTSAPSGVPTSSRTYSAINSIKLAKKWARLIIKEVDLNTQQLTCKITWKRLFEWRKTTHTLIVPWFASRCLQQLASCSAWRPPPCCGPKKPKSTQCHGRHKNQRAYPLSLTPTMWILSPLILRLTIII